jgi:membrane protein DedA with SNARE-associated domain
MDTTSVIDWISQNPEWAYWVIFAIAFLESLAVLGILVPGWLLLVGVGILIGTGTINYVMASIYCFFGAVLGEYISFAVGRHYQQNVRHWQIFKRHPDWLAKTDHFFERFGVASIALGRFVGPVRAFVPLIAGMSSMPLVRFQIINVLSALVWAPVYLIPGVVVGASSQLKSENTWWLVANMGVTVIAGWMTIVYLRNWWRRKHHDHIHEYDDQALGSKLLGLIMMTLVSVIILISGPWSDSFYELAALMISIITQAAP